MRGKKLLLVSSTGGHLAELAALVERVQPSQDSIWVTAETPQSRDVLRGRRHLFVDYVAPRDLRAAWRAARKVGRDILKEGFDACLSTGAALAGCILPFTAASGMETIYVESLARVRGPSLTGRLMRAAPGVRTLAQYPDWCRHGWHYSGNLLDDLRVEPSEEPAGPLKILVTLGTIHPYRFDRAVNALSSVLSPSDQITWQLGSTSRSDLPGRCFKDIPFNDLEHLMRQSDVVVAHAGVGSLLSAFAAQKAPVLLVRKADRGEHVDDHQEQFADVCTSRKVARLFDLSAPNREPLHWAARTRVIPAS